MNFSKASKVLFGYAVQRLTHTASSIALLLIMQCFFMNGFAVPANPRPFKYVQADGTTVMLRLVGDEHCHALLDSLDRVVEITEWGYVKVISHHGSEYVSNMRKAAAASDNMRYGALSKSICREAITDEVHGLIVLVNFSDLAFTDTRERIQRMMNEENYSENGATGSARDYFISQSTGRFKPTFDVIGPVTLELPCRYYGGNVNGKAGNDRHADAMIFSAVQKAAEQKLVDLSQYDKNNDGIVDMVYVIYAGYGEADGGDSNTIWPHMWNLQASSMFYSQKIDGKSLGLYACSAEYRGDNTFSGIGTFCHEYGHCLGLPDIYDTDYSGGYGMGSYDIMSHGSYLNNGNTPPNYSGFERHCLGWMELEEVQVSRDYTLLSIEESNSALKLSSRSNPDEYFVLENRQQQGWDKYLPAHGLLITHIDYNEEDWANNTVNDDPAHQHVMMMAADNLWNKTTQSGDLYPGLLDNKEFTDTSVPSSKLWDGSNLAKPVTDITLNGSAVTMHIELDTDGIGSSENQASNNVYRNSRIYNLNGQEVSEEYKGIVIRNGHTVINK